MWAYPKGGQFSKIDVCIQFRSVPFYSVATLLLHCCVHSCCIKKVHLTLRFISMVICILELANKTHIIACCQSHFQSVYTLSLALTHTLTGGERERKRVVAAIVQRMCRFFSVITLHLQCIEKVIKLFDVLDVDMKYKLLSRKAHAHEHNIIV